MLKIGPFHQGVTLRTGDSAPPLPQALSDRVDSIWKAEKLRRGDDLFDGRIFVIRKKGHRYIAGDFVNYRQFLAQQLEPGLFESLKVCPLAVTGYTLCGDGVVIGKRSSQVTQDAGVWELVPAGGVDDSALRADGTIDLGKTLCTELFEEIGIPTRALAAAPRPFVIIEDTASHVVDIGLCVKVDLSAKQVVSMFQQSRHREYTKLDVIEPDVELKAEPPLAPVSRAIFEFARQADFQGLKG